MLTVSARIVDDCGLPTCRTDARLERAKTARIRTVSAIIFAHC